MSEVAPADADAKLREWAESKGLWRDESSTESLLRPSPAASSESSASTVATVIAGVGWLCAGLGVVGFAAAIFNGRSTDVDVPFVLGCCASVAFSGLVTVGFASIVENVARMERRSQNR